MRAELACALIPLAIGACDRTIHLVGIDPAPPPDGAVPTRYSTPRPPPFEPPPAPPPIPVPPPGQGADWWTSLEPGEIAFRLAYFLWQQEPDQRLVDRVRANPPRRQSDIGRLSEEMLADPRSQPMMERFVEIWLGLSPFRRVKKDPVLFPRFDGAAGAMYWQVRQFAPRLLEPDTQLATLFRPEAPINDVLAPLYRIDEPSADFVWRRDLDPALDHAGLLTLPALMAMGGNAVEQQPSRRGAWFASSFLCLDWSPGHRALSLPPSPGATVRQRLAAATAGSGCNECHVRVDALGGAFEHFDTAGAYRSDEVGTPVDATGLLTLSGRRIVFDGARDLARRIVDDPDLLIAVERCYVAQWLAFANAHQLLSVVSMRQPDIAYVHRRAGATGSFHLREVIPAVTETKLFWFLR